MDYTSLTADILSWANRNEAAFVAQVPKIIDIAMSMICRDIKGPAFQKTVNGNMVAGNATIQKPQDFRQSVSLQYTIPGTTPYSMFLLERSYEFCITYAPNPTLRGQPLLYSTDLNVPPSNVAAAQIFIAPTPDNNYDYQFTYLSLPPLFNAQNPRNYLTDRHPDLLTFACMLIALPYLKSDERIPTFKQSYKEIVDAINKEAEGRYTDRTSMRDKD